MQYFFRKQPKDTVRSIIIENVVASAVLGENVDLDAIVKAFPSVDYRPERFPGLVYRQKKPKTAILVFQSGKLVCTGARSERHVFDAIHRLVNKLYKKNILQETTVNITIQNIVASASLGGKIDLETSAYTLGRTMYEPEQFPGMIYRMDDPKVVILLFASGKLVCTGAKNEEDVYDAVNKLQSELEEAALIHFHGIKQNRND